LKSINVQFLTSTRLVRLLRGVGLLEPRQVGEDFSAVFFRVDVEIGFADNAGGIDEEGVARGKPSDA
jgi:hypothetical protein